MSDKNLPTGFTFQVNKDGSIKIFHHGQLATSFRAKKASQVISKLERLDEAGQQHWMARLTGNYKHGNERLGKQSKRR